MSYFLCGQIQFSSSLTASEREELAFVLSKLALEQRLSLQLAVNIAQTEVFKILNCKDGGLSDSDVAFLLTDSPLSNTSDEIVNPDVEPSYKPYVMRERLRRVERFLASMNGIDSVSSVTLYVSLGYDTVYAEEDVPVEFLSNRITDFYTERFHIPSVCFKIRFRQDE